MTRHALRRVGLVLVVVLVGALATLLEAGDGQGGAGLSPPAVPPTAGSGAPSASPARAPADGRAGAGAPAPGAGDMAVRGEAPAGGEDPASAAGEPAEGLPSTVARIVDGDTLYLAGLPERARLVGIDTPETRHPRRGVECFGPQATAHLARLVPPGTAVTLTFDVERTDRYGRPLVYLWRTSDGLFVNLRMVADGYAQVLTVPPNVRHAERFVSAQREARAAGRGLWSACA